MSFQLAEDYLLQHAYTNVWCTPEQDKQARFQLARVTPANGVWTNFTYHWRKIGLPVAKTRFHVYHIGQVHPSILGLMDKANVWIPAPVAMQDENVLIQVYNGRGSVVPKCLCWYLITGDNNLLVAVRKSEQQPDLMDIDLESEPLFMRLYSNAYFNRAASTVLPAVRVFSKRCMTALEVVGAQTAVNEWPKVGGITYYVNGRASSHIDNVACRPGDYIEAVFDASIKHVVEYSVTGLREFNSEMDAMRKYLLTHNVNTKTIDFMDDVDMFVTTLTGTGRWTGTYLHKNDSRTMRQLTHRDYSVAVPRVHGAATANNHLNGKALRLRLVVRHSGYERALVMENSRLFELYKLPVAQRLEAMLGIDAHVDVWKASNLEKSAYTAVMGAKQGAITKDLVQQAYGYNALSVLLGDTPKKTSTLQGQNVVFIPEGLRGNATVYEYTEDGKLLTYDSITLDNTYTARDGLTKMAEVVFGVASSQLDIQTTATGRIESALSYRFYSAPALGGIQTGEWQDVTGQAHYLIQGNTYQWTSTANKLVRVVSNKRHLGYTTYLKPVGGVLEFDLMHQTTRGLEKLDLVLGQLDIFVNGFSLIEGLDYTVKKSRVVVCSKEYLVGDSSQTQEVVIRYMGFADTNLQREIPQDRGFVYNGVLSANKSYNLRDDKVLRIVVDGKLRLREDLKFAEDGITPSVVNALNGAPYAIKDIVVPMNSYLVAASGNEDRTMEMRARSQVVDKQVGDYMTIKKPQAPATMNNAVTARYKLYSPFLARIYSDLKNDILWENRFIEHFGDDYVREIAQRYAYLLDFDPIAGEPKVDTRYVVVHPHMEPGYGTLTMYQFRVLQRITALYAPGVDLASTVNVLQF